MMGLELGHLDLILNYNVGCNNVNPWHQVARFKAVRWPLITMRHYGIAGPHNFPTNVA